MRQTLTEMTADTSQKTAAIVPARADPQAPGSVLEDLLARARRVAVIAGQNADDVDLQGRHPAEAIGAAQAERLLGVMAPPELGGEGAATSDVAEVCYILGRACASTGMIYAMHSVKVACVVSHGLSSAWHRRFLQDLSKRQLLVASSTTEGRGGGDIRNSEAPIEASGGRIQLVRDASVISYGADADVIVTTARRSPEAAASDQVLAVFMRTDYALEPVSGWDTLGMRGTCSAGFTLRATGDAHQVLPHPYAAIHVQTMVPTSHILWASVWAGVASAAVERARRHTRRGLREGSGAMPPSAHYFTKAHADLRALRALISSSLDRYAVLVDQPEALSTVEFQSAISLLKVEASELAVSAAMNALRACGLSGYRNGSEVSVGRHLRDLLSAPMMINNDRILQTTAGATLLNEVFASIRD
jgi:acyl-CoA dehydrogenase